MKNSFIRRIATGGACMLLGVGVSAFYLQKPSSFVSARLFNEILQLTTQNYVDSISQDSLYVQAARGMLKELNDPYTVLMTPKERENFARQMGGQYAGIGTSVGRSEGVFVIMRVYPNSPAAKAGLLEGDKVVMVDTTDVRTLDDQQISERLRGPAGTKVQVKVKRDGITDPLVIDITRQVIHLPAVPYAIVLEGNVGYIPFQQFSSSSAREVTNAIDSVVTQGATKIIIDLRNNGGGLTDQATSIANLFLPEGKEVLSMRGHSSNFSQIFQTQNHPRHPDIPLVVLVNGQSASSSEILAGALQDYDRAVIIGTTTYGKGVAQGVYNLESGYGLKMTTQRWYTPLGRSIQKKRKLAPDDTYVEIDPDSLETDSARNARPRFTTPGGRTVLGGGGITPDVRVTGSELSNNEKKLTDFVRPKIGLFNTELNAFAIEHRSKVKSDFTVTPKMRSDFVSRLQKKGIVLDKALLTVSGSYIDRLIGQRISTLAFGDSTTKRKYLSEDSQLLKAVSMLKIADNQKALLSAATKQQNSAPMTSR